MPVAVVTAAGGRWPVAKGVPNSDKLASGGNVTAAQPPSRQETQDVSKDSGKSYASGSR